MLCALSGEAPQSPVVSTKSGHVFERHLIETYIKENGRDPINQEELGTDDLLELKSARVSRPRPPAFTSIPSLLSEFQKEWDAVALETFNLRQQLQQTRQELSTALYQNDAAVRVIARLTAERNEARGVLAKINVREPSTTNGDGMQVDATRLPADLALQVEATQEKLSKTRRKRAVPEDWATDDSLASMKAEAIPKIQIPSPTSLSLNETRSEALVGGASGDAEEVSISGQEILQKFQSGGGATSIVAWSGARCILGSTTGTVQVFDGKSQVCAFSAHTDAVTAIAVHPSGGIIASVSLDKSIVFYDLTKATRVSQLFSDSALTTAAFHPDGHLLAAGGRDGQIKVFDVKSGVNAANFETSAAVNELDFSENGTWLATVSKNETDVRIWDLRKSSQIKSLEIGYSASSVKWDYSGQFLATAGPQGVAIHRYAKATKEWSELKSYAVPAKAVEWGPNARSLIVLGMEGSLTVMR